MSRRRNCRPGSPSGTHCRPTPHLRDGGRYRRRRHGSFIVDGTRVVAVPQRAHWQPLEYNALHGGIERWFEPLPAALVNDAAWATLLAALGGCASAPARRPALVRRGASLSHRHRRRRHRPAHARRRAPRRRRPGGGDPGGAAQRQGRRDARLRCARPAGPALHAGRAVERAAARRCTRRSTRPRRSSRRMRAIRRSATRWC